MMSMIQLPSCTHSGRLCPNLWQVLLPEIYDGESAAVFVEGTHKLFSPFLSLFFPTEAIAFPDLDIGTAIPVSVKIVPPNSLIRYAFLQ